MFHRFLFTALALLLGSTAAFGQADAAKMDAARAHIRGVLVPAINFYAFKMGDFPVTLQKLLETKPPILESKEALIDPWGKPYKYDKAGQKNDGKLPEIWTESPSKQIISNLPAEKNPKKDDKEPKKDEPKKTTPGLIDVDDFIKKLPANLPKEQVDRIRMNLEQANQRLQEAQKRADDLRKRPLPNIPDRRAALSTNRLGVRLEKPNDTLVAQLGLPAGKGQVLADIKDGSAAAKAGLKANDILVEFAGKEVSSNAAEFVKALNEIKKDTAVDAVVLRMGKRETIKGITLPDAPSARRTLEARKIEIKRKLTK